MKACYSCEHKYDCPFEASCPTEIQRQLFCPILRGIIPVDNEAVQTDARLDLIKQFRKQPKN